MTARNWEDHINPVTCHPIQQEVAEFYREQERLIEQVIEELRAEGEPMRRNYPVRVTDWTPARIKDLRMSLGLNVRDMAERISVSPSAWNWWERGTRVPRDEYLQRLNDLDAGIEPDRDRVKWSRTLEHPEWTAERIKQLRIDLGYKQSEMAALVYVSVQSWSLWETGINRPKPENIARLIELDGGGRIA